MRRRKGTRHIARRESVIVQSVGTDGQVGMRHLKSEPRLDKKEKRLIILLRRRKKTKKRRVGHFSISMSVSEKWVKKESNEHRA